MFVVLTRLAAAAPTVAFRHARASSALLLQQVNVHFQSYTVVVMCEALLLIILGYLSRYA